MSVLAWILVGCMVVMCLPGVQTRRGPIMWDNPGPYVSIVAEIVMFALVWEVLFG